jgi:hypothetical protein
MGALGGTGSPWLSCPGPPVTLTCLSCMHMISKLRPAKQHSRIAAAPLQKHSSIAGQRLCSSTAA